MLLTITVSTVAFLKMDNPRMPFKDMPCCKVNFYGVHKCLMNHLWVLWCPDVVILPDDIPIEHEICSLLMMNLSGTLHSFSSPANEW
jgi:hypothetical protein